MKKITLLLFSFISTSLAFAQCLTTDDANNTISSCQYGNWNIGKDDESTSNIITVQAQKWTVTIFNSIIYPAILKTKGLRGSWSAAVKISTDDGLCPYRLYSIMQELGCNKNKKLYEKEESGIIIEFGINTLYKIAQAMQHEEYILVKKSKEKITVYDKLNGRQLYLLNQPTASEQFGAFAYYRKEVDGSKNILIAKEGIPVFMPVTIKDVLLRIKNNYAYELNYENTTYTDFINLGVEGYLKQADLTNVEQSSGKEVAEKLKAELKIDYEKQVIVYKKMVEDNPIKKWITIIDNYLKKSSIIQLTKPCIVSREIFITDDYPITDALFLDSPADGMQYITINSAYANKKNPTTPQFVVMHTTINAKSAVSLSAKKTFEDNVDFQKLRAILAK